jgi:hypothetical protein
MVYKHISDINISYTISSVDAQKLNPENLIDCTYIFEICNKGMFICWRAWMLRVRGYMYSRSLFLRRIFAQL